MNRQEHAKGFREQELGGRTEGEVLRLSPVNTTEVHTVDLVGWAQNDNFPRCALLTNMRRNLFWGET
jgi:hypothetical protein